MTTTEPGRTIVVASTKASADLMLAERRPDLNPQRAVLILGSSIEQFEQQRGFIWNEDDELLVEADLDLTADQRLRICRALISVRHPAASLGPTIAELELLGLYEPAAT